MDARQQQGVDHGVGKLNSDRGPVLTQGRPYATGNWLPDGAGGPDQCIRISMSALTVPRV